MINILRHVVYGLVVLIGVVILFVIVREAIRAFKGWAWRRKRSRCFSLIGDLDGLTLDDILPLATGLKKSFAPSIIESVLDEFRLSDLKSGEKMKLAEIYEQVGIVGGYLKDLSEAKSWTDRAFAASHLGEIGHPNAVLPLLACLSDANEEAEVKHAAIQALGNVRDERAIGPFIVALGLPDTAISGPVADAIVRFGRAAAQPLMNVLAESMNESQRFWAARILGRLGVYPAAKTLLAALQDRSAKVRAEAALSLGLLEAREAVTPLSKMLLEDPVSIARDAAAEAMGRIADDRVLATLKEGLADLDYTTRKRAMEAMEKMGERALPFFYDALGSDSVEAVIQAASAMERMGLVALKVEELAGEKWADAFALLSRIARAGVVETMARSLTHSDHQVRTRLCSVLSESANPRTFEALTEVAKNDPERDARFEAVRALIRFADERSVPILAQALSEGPDEIKGRLLASLQGAPRSFIEKLASAVMGLAENADAKVREEVVKTLSAVQSDGVFQILLSALSDASPDVRREAARVICRYPGKGAGVRALIEALNDPDREVRVAAIRSLGVLKDPSAITPLAEAFERADEGYRDDIANALAAMPSGEFYKLADLLMGLSDPKSRAGVAWTLGLIGDEKSVKLIASFLKDPDPAVRASAAGAIGRFKKGEMIPVLLEYLSDPNEKVRAAVVNSLTKVGDASVIKGLLALLENEPDAFVCQRVALGAGALARNDDPGTKPVKASAIGAVRKWLGRAEQINDGSSVICALISLALLGDKGVFQRAVGAAHDRPERMKMQGFLKDFSMPVQERFFNFLSIEPYVFWMDEEAGSHLHYINLLQSSRDASQRLNAIAALSALGERSAIPAIEAAFAKDPNSAVRAGAISALGKFLTGDDLIGMIMRAVDDPSDEVRAQVLPMLERLSPKELDASRDRLIPLLDGPDEKIRGKAARLLARLFNRDWQVLADKLLGTEKTARLKGLIETLGEIADPKMGALWEQFMKHSEPEVRGAAAWAAANSGALTKEQWLDYLNDPQEDVRIATIRGLKNQLDSLVVDALSKQLEDPSVAVRREIALVLGGAGMSDKENVLGSLRRMTGDVNPEVRLLALVSLFHLGGQGLSEMGAHAIQGVEEWERKDIIERMQKEGLFTDVLSALRHGEDPLRRGEAIKFLAALGIQYFAKDVARSLKDPSPGVRLAAVEALGQVDDPDIHKLVGLLSDDPAEEIRQAVKRKRLKVVDKSA